MSRGIIYLITNKENGYKYIGQTTQSMNKRWQHHILESRKMSSLPLHKAFRDYGIDKFTIREIDECQEQLLNEKEEYWIRHYHSELGQEGYNIPLDSIKEELPPPSPKRIIHRPPLKPKNESWGSLTEKNRGNGKHSGLKIQGLHIPTGKIKCWDNARLAAQEITGNPKKNSNILTSARKGYIYYDHEWTILEDKPKKKAIFGVHKKLKTIGPQFESIADACRQLGDGGHGSGLIKSLKHPGRFSWRGYYWYYKYHHKPMGH